MLQNRLIAGQPPGRRILVVDDEPGIRSFISRALTAAGYGVREARGGYEGLQAALRHPHDVVLLDICLPDLNGQEVLRRLRQKRPGQAVLAWSATSDPDLPRRCLSLGARAYLHKPCPLTELMQCVAANC